ncbi:hypothetical protein QFZ37_004001 [Chryseobacterium ginsenosidimutans]|uniref:hypothetical protein n=1 Tax=Chryseobacterium ginsenosidimutans TaxID=687846 RepID=UPI0027859DF8|nr:hypothetical protein [Chryseobacterium ginsenosidimutans]MDQ0595632.1 hypothetical protein [Chryseobacterium ginsenosidimutans]
MKKIILGALMITFGVMNGQKAISNSKIKANKIDKNLVGLWKGSEKDQQIIGMEKLWIMERKEDGTFMLLFTTIQNCVIDQQVEKGQWWVENGEFHELHFNSGQADIYNYQILDPSHIKFKSKEQSIQMSTDEYSFVDTRIEEEDQ